MFRAQATFLLICFMQDGTLPFPPLLHGFLNSCSATGCHLRAREKPGMTETWLLPPLPSAQRSGSLLKHLTASPGSRSPAGSLLGRFHQERKEAGGAGHPFFSALGSGTGSFICCSEALLMQKEHIQHRAPWRAVGIIMPLFIILKQTQFGVWIYLEV